MGFKRSPRLGGLEVKSSSLARHLLALVGKLTKRDNTSPPTIVPFDRRMAEVKPAEDYGCDAAVWAYIGGVWTAGRVVESAEAWVLVRYSPPGSGHLAIEALAAPYVKDRAPSG